MNRIIVYLCLIPLLLTGCAHRVYTDQQKSWALATTALLCDVNSERYDILDVHERTEDYLGQTAGELGRWWGILDRRDLLNTLRRLETTGYRKKYAFIASHITDPDQKLFPLVLEQVDNNQAEAEHRLKVVKETYQKVGDNSLIAWDFCRYIYLCRKGYFLGFLSETEAWDMIMPIAIKLQHTYNSWKELGEHYLIGREFWSYEQTRIWGEQFASTYKKLVSDAQSPWNRIPWNLDLQPHYSTEQVTKPATHENTNNVLSRSYYAKGAYFHDEHMKALRFYDEAIRLNPDNYFAWYGRALIMHAMNRREKALEIYNKIIAMHPDFKDAWFSKGVVLDELNRLEESLEAYEETIRINPRYAMAWCNKGYILGKLNRIEESLKAEEKALEIQPDFPLALSNKGYILSKLNRLDEALAAQEKALKLQPDYPLALYNRACVSALKGNMTGAVRDLKRAVQLDSNFKEIARNDQDFAALKDNPDFCTIIE